MNIATAILTVLALASLAAPPSSPDDTAADDTAADDTAAADPLFADACPRLFGGARASAENAEYREASLLSLQHDQQQRLVVIHAVASWQAPHSVRIPGLVTRGVADILVEHDGETREERALLVELQEPLTGFCPRGPYALVADDALGAFAAVLSVDSWGALIDDHGSLRTVVVPGVAAPQPRMVWRSSYDIVLDESGGSGIATTAGKGAGENAKKKPA